MLSCSRLQRGYICWVAVQHYIGSCSYWLRNFKYPCTNEYEKLQPVAEVIPKNMQNIQTPKKVVIILTVEQCGFTIVKCIQKMMRNCKWWRLLSHCSYRSRLIRACTVCSCLSQNWGILSHKLQYKWLWGTVARWWFVILRNLLISEVLMLWFTITSWNDKKLHLQLAIQWNK